MGQSLSVPCASSDMSELPQLECPVCMTMPEGEVHQCNEGHCYCVDCWNRLDPRRCPECRQPIQDSNRNRDREARIAALEASCDHCAKPMTRGTKASHMLVCPQRPTACAGAAAGCSWLGVAAEQAAHEAACTIAVCQRMIGPLQARCDGLQSQNQQLQARSQELSQELQARVGSIEPLQAQNQQLQRQVAALQPLTGRVRALEGDAEAGGQQQRQRVRAAPHVDDARVFKVRVRAGDLVDQVEFHVAGPNSETPVVETYGGNGGRQCADFDLNPGEWLAAVLRRQGNSLDAVCFETNTGRQSQWYGNQSGGRLMPRLAAPAGNTIVGLRRPSGGCCPGIQDIVCVLSPRTSTPWRGFRLLPYGTRE
eukprot:scaffold66302_cov57-Phaeocystis_antarctica.AAC.1